MDDIIQTIDPDKRDRIINAAIEEFASFPYEKASTNNIVKNAGISKGLLFHYFSSKKQLYETLLKFVVRTLYHTVIDKINWDETDLFERIKQAAMVKLEVSRVYPHMFDFMQKILIRECAGSVEKVMELYKSYGLEIELLYEGFFTKNVDYSKFRDPSTITETINIVRWSLEKYAEDQMLRFSAYDKLDLQSAVSRTGSLHEHTKESFLCLILFYGEA